MQCADNSRFGLLGMMIFLGWTISAVIVPRLADIYGRKPTFIINYLVELLAVILMIYSRTFEIMAVALFLIGVCSAGRWTVTYIYLMEFWTDNNIKKYGPFVNSSAALALIIGAFMFQFCTKKTVTLEYLSAIMTVIALIGILFIPESPKWLVG